jgi:hypothetical protein
MTDEPDPPRKLYGFKPAEFETANEPPRNPVPAAESQPAPDPGITRVHEGRIDVRELARIATGDGAVLGHNATANRPNEVHGILRENFERDKAAGWYEVDPREDKRRVRRIRNYWILLVVVDAPLGLFAYKIGHGAAIPFVCTVAAIALFTTWWTWETWFLRTD